MRCSQPPPGPAPRQLHNRGWRTALSAPLPARRGAGGRGGGSGPGTRVRAPSYGPPSFAPRLGRARFAGSVPRLAHCSFLLFFLRARSCQFLLQRAIKIIYDQAPKKNKMRILFSATEKTFHPQVPRSAGEDRADSRPPARTPARVARPRCRCAPPARPPPRRRALDLRGPGSGIRIGRARWCTFWLSALFTFQVVRWSAPKLAAPPTPAGSSAPAIRGLLWP